MLCNQPLLFAESKPELVYWFSEQTLQPGPSVSLKCVAMGHPPPQFTWLLDGFPIPTNSRYIRTGNKQTIFTIDMFTSKKIFSQRTATEAVCDFTNKKYDKYFMKPRVCGQFLDTALWRFIT